ncbi:DUF1634 domain-containing protein [bacterium]|jgi:uncharacterized membrane protein|nr:DUF1634 domain-containing protein [bacterium]
MTQHKHAAEDLISALLRKGVLFSGSFILIGWVQSILETSSGSHRHEEVWTTLLGGGSSLSFSSESLMNQRLGWDLLLTPHSSLWITLGLLSLLMVPILRIILSAWAFYRERDYLFVLFSCVVLGVLSVGLLLGHSL